MLDALSSPVRREILWLTRDAELSAGEIARQFDLAGPTVSEHLRVLRQAHLVTQRRLGTFRFYRANPIALRAIRPLVQEAGSKWLPADDIAERSLATAQLRAGIVVAVDVPLTQQEAFASFATGPRFAAWLGVPVSIDEEGRFATTLEWGTQVRGRYEIVVPPTLIALRWDFEDQSLPIPGAERTAYLRFSRIPGGTHVEVQQWLETEEQAQFLAGAWQMVLGRFASSVTSQASPAPRRSRPKRRPRR
jgi:DNA-binding transcriptional ArsR family regulator/uncharacterized protein YndB with AHSA1/START domain